MRAKAEVRTEILKKRDLMNKLEVETKSKEIIKNLKSLINEINKDRCIDKYVLAYMPFKNEVNLKDFYQEIYDDKLDFKLAFPKVYKDKMDFLKVDSNSDFEVSKFGILEPKKINDIIEPKNNIVLVPCVAIHKDKTRLGFGGGYYDRFFKDRNNNILIGIAYDFQKDMEFSYDAYDIKMDYIV